MWFCTSVANAGSVRVAPSDPAASGRVLGDELALDRVELRRAGPQLLEPQNESRRQARTGGASLELKNLGRGDRHIGHAGRQQRAWTLASKTGSTAATAPRSWENWVTASSCFFWASAWAGSAAAPWARSSAVLMARARPRACACSANRALKVSAWAWVISPPALIGGTVTSWGGATLEKSSSGGSLAITA